MDQDQGAQPPAGDQGAAAGAGQAGGVNPPAGGTPTSPTPPTPPTPPAGDQGTGAGQAAPLSGGQGGATGAGAPTPPPAGDQTGTTVPGAGAPVGDQGSGAAQAAGDQGAGATGAGAPTPPPGGAAAGTGAGQAGDENYLRPRPPDSELGIGSIGDFATTVAVPAHSNTTFDESYFLKMLAGSISLTKNEKAKIVESIPKLSQYQIDELIKIFEEERRKFSELDEKHQVKIRELQAKQTEDWKDLEMAGQQEERKGEDEAAAEALRAKLAGGGGEEGKDEGEVKQAA